MNRYKPSYTKWEDIYNQVIRYMNLDIPYTITYVMPSVVEFLLVYFIVFVDE